MTLRRATSAILLLSFLILAVAPRVGAAPDWWNDNWQFRRKVSLVRTAQRWKDSPAAWVKFHTGGKIKPDGSDIRVVTRSGKLVRSTVKGVGPGDEVLLVFEVLANEDEYHIYHGYPGAPSQKDYDPQRGLMLETRRRGPGDPNTWADMQRIIRESDFVWGRGFVPQAYDGQNRFGPSTDFISLYTGWILAPVSGKYTFCTASDDASFLFVDGRLICQWPGYHGAQAGLWGRFSGTVTLDKGMHRFEYYHLQAGETTAVVAGWKQPGMEDKDVSLIPDWAFPGLMNATAKPLEQRDSPVTADFALDCSDDLEFESFLFQLAKFSPQVSSAREVTSWRWDFGDGATSTQREPVHVYLEPGIYPVTLEVVDNRGAKSAVTHKVQVVHVLPLSGKNYLIEKQMEKFRPLMGDHDPSRLSPQHLAALWSFFEALKDDKALGRLVTSLLARLKDLQSEHLQIVAEKLGEFLVKSKDYGNAEKVYDLLIASPLKVAQAKGLIKKGELYLFHLSKPEEARQFFEKAVSDLRRTATSELRLALVRMGDCGKYAADYEGAQQWYGEAEAMLLPGRTPRQALGLRGAYAQSVEALLREKAWDQAREELDLWEWEFPLERLDGNSSLIRCRLAFETNDMSSCVTEAEVLVKVNPTSNYADKLLLIAAEAHVKLKDKASALRKLRAIVTDYPTSPLVGEVKAKIAALGG